MSKQVLIYWRGIIGIPGKGPNWVEPYDPNMTIGQIIKILTIHGLGENNKRIEIFKHQYGSLDKYDKNNPYWSHSTTLAEYSRIMGGTEMMIYCIVN